MAVSKLGLRQFLVGEHVDPRIVTYVLNDLGIHSVEDFANRWEHHEHGTALQKDVVERVEPFRSNPKRRPSQIQAARLKTAWIRARGESEASTQSNGPSSSVTSSAQARTPTASTRIVDVDEAIQQRYVLPKETPSPLLKVDAEPAHRVGEVTQQKYVPPTETSSPLVQVLAEKKNQEAEATQQRNVLPKKTHEHPPHFNAEVIGHMLKAPLLDGEHSEQEEGVVNLDVEEDDESDGAPPKNILYASYLLILTYWVVGFLYGRFSAGWSLVDSMYFVAVTVTTVGYGDKTFQSGTGLAKICGGIYVFVGVLIISAAAGVILGALQAKTEARVKRMMAENEKKMLKTGGETPEFNLNAEIRGVFLEVSKGLILVVIALAAGCTGMLYFQEDWSFADAFYFCCVTMTTVGYGDLVPTNDGSKVFVTVYILFAFGVLASIMSEVGAIPFRIEELRKIDKCLSLLGDSLDSEELAALCGAKEIVQIRNEQQLTEAEEEPFVSRAEFAIWQLIKQGKLKMDDILRCMQTFDKLDEDGSGKLDQEDIDLFLQREKEKKNNSLQAGQSPTDA